MFKTAALKITKHWDKFKVYTQRAKNCSSIGRLNIGLNMYTYVFICTYIQNIYNTKTQFSTVELSNNPILNYLR